MLTFASEVNPQTDRDFARRFNFASSLVDTIGQNTQTFVDDYRTPPGEKLHVVERFRIINDGKSLQPDNFLDDPASSNRCK